MVSKIDPGQIYFITELDQKTKNSTGYYKIGIVRNQRITFDRIKEHQTGNPHRLYAAEVIITDAAYMVEGMLHGKFHAKRVSQEWFHFTPTELAAVVAEAKRLSGIYGPVLSSLRSTYSVTPSNSVLTLTGKDLKKAEDLRDKAYKLDKKIMSRKYQMKAIELALQTATSIHGLGIDGVTYVEHKQKTTKFSLTEWKKSATPAQLKACEKAVKPKDDFRFLYPKNKGKAAKKDLKNPHWKSVLTVEFNQYETNLKAFIPNPTSAFKETSLSRTKAFEKMHEEYAEHLVEQELLNIELQTIILEMRAICQNHEEVQGICEWKRKPQKPEINESLMKKNYPADTVKPKFMTTTNEKSEVKVYGFRPYI
ncbi:MAG: GIY-YIG nuclease family protein [Euryarchaeota archaeon]|nr:GIY-YIG nuclease family protein [Euryarchaeota archaeon]